MGFDEGQKILLRRVISRLQLDGKNPTASKPVASEASLLPGLDLQQELCRIERSPNPGRLRTLMCPKPLQLHLLAHETETVLHTVSRCCLQISSYNYDYDYHTVMLKYTFTSLPSCPQRLTEGYRSCLIRVCHQYD